VGRHRLADRSDILVMEPRHAALDTLAGHMENNPAYRGVVFGRDRHRVLHPVGTCDDPWKRAQQGAHVESIPEQVLLPLADKENTGIEMKGWRMEQAVDLM